MKVLIGRILKLLAVAVLGVSLFAKNIDLSKFPSQYNGVGLFYKEFNATEYKTYSQIKAQKDAVKFEEIYPRIKKMQKLFYTSKKNCKWIYYYEHPNHIFELKCKDRHKKFKFDPEYMRVENFNANGSKGEYVEIEQMSIGRSICCMSSDFNKFIVTLNERKIHKKGLDVEKLLKNIRDKKANKDCK